MRGVWSLFWLLGSGGCRDRETPVGDDSAPPDTSDTADDGSIAWEVVSEDAAEGAFLSVWGASAEDVWIVGGQPETGVVLRGHGQTWAPLALPAGTPLLNWVHGTGPDDVWVAGLRGALLHWDGAAWVDHTITAEAAFWGLYAHPTSGEVLAVGGASRWGGEAAMVWRYDGAVWSSVALPEKLAGLSNLFKVTHDGEQYWLVGVGGAAVVGDGQQLVAAPTGTASDLVTAHHDPASDVLAVVGGRGTGVIMAPDASGTGLSLLAQANAGLSGVFVYPGGDTVVVGERGYSARFSRADGTLTETLAITLDILHATWGTPGGQMYAVGGNLNTAEDSFHGIILTAAAPE